MTTAADGRQMPQLSGLLHNRWFQAVVALLVMLMISPYEYTFTLFEEPYAKANHVGLTAVAFTFTVYIVVAALFMIPSGRWSDRWQPRWFTTAAGVLTGAGWLASAHMHTAVGLWIAYGLGALGPGYIYCNCVNNALKWFPEARKRGLAVGLIDMGFGAGSAIFIPFLQQYISAGTFGYETAFTLMGVAMLVVIVIAAQFLRFPPKGYLPPGFDPVADRTVTNRTRTASRDYTPREMLRTWQSYAAWIGLTLITGAGLMVTAHVAAIAGADLALGAGVGLAAATYSRIPNGVMRWIGGGISDHIGRELSMFISFCIMGLMLLAMTVTNNGPLFVVETCVAFGTWGPLFSIYPALVGDYWGRGNSGVNYGIIYTGKAAGGVYAGYLAAYLFGVTGSWKLDFYIAAAMAIVSGVIALTLRNPSPAPATDEPPPVAVPEDSAVGSGREAGR
ncbi:MAG TPA: OFA family MFS transporter [Pseudonocardiaceae bacterium]|jgi:OFA family oxalate/formate antiporter-like MFS transporter|nr:OFA family MFS transporter [Pseudonocardiaceae bacterium]